MSETCREYRLGEGFFRRLRHPFLARGVISVALLLAALFPAVARADIGDMVMGDGSVSLNRDAQTGKRGVSYDVNVAAAFFNVGVTLRAWDGSITGWNGRQVNDELAVYAGVGFFNLFEVQRGYSNAGARYRIRALISLGKNFPLPNDEKKPGMFGRGVMITPFMETGSGKRVYGVGLVVVF